MLLIATSRGDSYKRIGLNFTKTSSCSEKKVQEVNEMDRNDIAETQTPDHFLSQVQRNVGLLEIPYEIICFRVMYKTIFLKVGRMEEREFGLFVDQFEANLV